MSNTAVPLQPTPKGVMSKLWIGVAAAVVLGAGLAVAGTHSVQTYRTFNATCGKGAFSAVAGAKPPIQTPSGLKFQTVKAGEGEHPSADDVTLVNYRGTLTNGTQFDAHDRAVFPVSGVIPGFTEALKMMQKGGVYRICIPPQLGYGSKAIPGSPIPANSTLRFDVQLLDFKSQAEVQAQMQQQMQQMQAQGAGQPGADQAIPGAR